MCFLAHETTGTNTSQSESRSNTNASQHRKPEAQHTKHREQGNARNHRKIDKPILIFLTDNSNRSRCMFMFSLEKNWITLSSRRLKRSLEFPWKTFRGCTCLLFTVIFYWRTELNSDLNIDYLSDCKKMVSLDATVVLKNTFKYI